MVPGSGRARQDFAKLVNYVDPVHSTSASIHVWYNAGSFAVSVDSTVVCVIPLHASTSPGVLRWYSEGSNLLLYHKAFAREGVIRARTAFDAVLVAHTIQLQRVATITTKIP